VIKEEKSLLAVRAMKNSTGSGNKKYSNIIGIYRQFFLFAILTIESNATFQQ
jgi:hypothetical protein